MRTNRNNGMTFLELIIAATIFGVIVIVALGFTSAMMDNTDRQFAQVAMQNKMDGALKTIMGKYAESTGSMGYALQYDNPVKSLIIFPTPRNQFGHFEMYDTNEEGQISRIDTSPKWCGWVLIYIFNGDLVMVKDYREGHTFSKATPPVIVYPNDLADPVQEYLYYSDGTMLDEDLVEWEFPKDYSRLHEYPGMSYDILGRNVTCFRAEMTNGKLSLSVTGKKRINKDREIVVSYTDTKVGRNNN